jgi:hypothetical protein
MSFCFGVGHFLTVGQLALRLYNACNGTPEEFTQRKADLSFLAYPALYPAVSRTRSSVAAPAQPLGQSSNNERVTKEGSNHINSLSF